MRIWDNKRQDDGSIHPIGNGNLIMYGRGPEIEELIGPPYSMPSFLKLRISGNERHLSAESQREKGTAIWTHTIFEEGSRIAAFTDCILPFSNIFISEIEAEGAMDFGIIPHKSARVCIMKKYFCIEEKDIDCLLVTIPKGTRFFTGEATLKETSALLIPVGAISLDTNTEGGFLLRISPGYGRLIISCGEYPSAVEHAETAIKLTPKECFESSRTFWKEFTSRRKNFDSLIPDEHPLKNRILDAIDSVSVLVKCQQSTSGGVAAGHIYPMAYVRDQSGVFRGLLALGYKDEAKAILEFWWNKWKIFGSLTNADCMGSDATRLLFNNDEVEVPAYIINNCFIYLKYTGENEYIRKLFPMLEWAFRVQLSQLSEGMTGFSADETYIAGGTFPKTLIYQGSAESTLLFVTGGEKLLRWAEANRILPLPELEKFKATLSIAKDRYKENFFTDGVLYANNPIREKTAVLPRFTYGYCESHVFLYKETFLGWNERNHQGYYICPKCRDSKIPDFIHCDNREKRHVLSSVSLVPAYIECELFDTNELKQIIQPLIELFKEKNTLPSNVEGTRALGYDCGLFLYNLVMLGHPLKEKVLEKMLDLLDPTGAWVEYYDNDVPHHCRARAWESAINIEAIINYINTGK